MTGRWITVSLVALALAGCHKKEDAKPPPPTSTAETAQPPAAAVVPATPATTTTPTTTPTTAPAPATETAATEPTPPAPGVTPVTTPDAPRSFVPTKPLKMAMRSSAMVMAPRAGGRPPPIRPVKSKTQLKAERDVLGLWTEQKNHSVINFTVDGRVTYVDKITDKPVWKGDWKAAPDGSVEFGLAMPGATGSIQYTAYPTSASIMAVAPHWIPEWGASGQYAFEKMH
jgi:hypothetical protein